MARAKSESGNVEGWQSVFPPFEQLEKRGGEEERERERKKKLFLNVGKFETKNETEDIVRMKLKFVKIHYPFWFRFFLFFFGKLPIVEFSSFIFYKVQEAGWIVSPFNKA